MAKKNRRTSRIPAPVDSGITDLDTAIDYVLSTMVGLKGLDMRGLGGGYIYDEMGNTWLIPDDGSFFREDFEERCGEAGIPSRGVGIIVASELFIMAYGAERIGLDSATPAFKEPKNRADYRSDYGSVFRGVEKMTERQYERVKAPPIKQQAAFSSGFKGLSGPQVRVMSLLSSFPFLTMEALYDGLGRRPGSLERTIRALERKGAIRRSFAGGVEVISAR